MNKKLYFSIIIYNIQQKKASKNYAKTMHCR